MEHDSDSQYDPRRSLTRPAGLRFDLSGEIGKRLQAVTEQWLLPAPLANPRMLEMFRERDLRPFATQVPWAGEFAGKYLISGVQILRLTGDAKLREHLEWFVGELVFLQAEDGYLGPWPEPWRLRPGAATSTEEVPWDAWGHYNIMLGLILWHELTGDNHALGCVRRIADLFCRRFLHGEERLHDTQEHEKNQAPVHALAILYRMTANEDYLRLAERIVEEFALPPAGDYYRQGLADVPFHRTPKPRWESLHPIMGLVELYYATGEDTCRRAFENLWWSMLKGDRHNNGGFTSGEKATGNPYDPHAIETCCTVAWSAMSVEMLQLTGNPTVADELELVLLNSALGLISPSGRWVTYNTPMDGVREASGDTIVFQSRAGSPELNCCSVNGPRLLGLVSEWALLRRQPDEVCLNYYGPGITETELPSGQALRLNQRTGYPVAGEVEIGLELDEPEEFALLVRIPAWSLETSVEVNGQPAGEAVPGRYLSLRRRWQPGDTVTLTLDMSLHCWPNPQSPAGARSTDGTIRETSLYRGPLLLAYDPAFNGGEEALQAGLDAANLPMETGQTDRRWLAPQLLLRTHSRDGKAVQLCDFASAGLSGTRYTTWLPMWFPGEPAAPLRRSPFGDRTRNAATQPDENGESQ